MSENAPVLLNTKDGSLDEELLEGIELRGFGVPCNMAVICPIQASSSKNILGFLIMGLNPRRPYDEDYQGFIHLLTQQITTPHVEALLAALERAELSEQLLVRTQEFKQSEMKFSRFAERSAVGLVIMDPLGEVMYANQAWFNITMNTRDSTKILSWLDIVISEDRAHAEEMWRRMVIDHTPINFQCRLKKPWRNAEGEETYTSVICSGHPDLNEDGSIKSVMGSVTDVSELKWVEAELRRRTEEVELRMNHALEMKRQQENFIDVCVCPPLYYNPIY
jgi:PAS domain S-box-containing protein